jgi:transposase
MRIKLGRCILAVIVRKVIINALPFTLPGFIINTTRREEACLIVEASSTATSALCPNCQQFSRHSHGWYLRRPQDLPCIGEGVYLELTVRRFRCLNPECPKKTFAEGFPEWLPTYARRTIRLTHVLQQVGFEVSAESGRRILRWLKIKVSGDTLLRIVKRTVIGPPTTATIVGMDDWALRKGHNYGTIIIDQETRRVVELLQGRTAEEVQPWFKTHPEVKLVTRDRSPEYRNALTTAAPQSQQVLDRWHLLQNLRHLAERVVASAYSRLKKLPIPPELLPKRLILPRPEHAQKKRAASRQRRLDFYNEIQRLKQAGVSATNVAIHLHHNYYTVRFYYNAPEFPERMPGRGPHSHLQPHLAYLEQRFGEGCDNSTQLYQELQARGYPATRGPVAAWVRARRLQAGEDPRIAHTNLPLTNSSSILPSAYKLSWFMVLPPAKLKEAEQALLEHLRQDAVMDQFYELAQVFRQMVSQRLVERLDDWLKAAANSSLKTVRYFGKFLQDEYSFIRAALEHDWSNGQTEGQINRLKFIKRQMYGRASFELLRQKVLYHPGST